MEGFYCNIHTKLFSSSWAHSRFLYFLIIFLCVFLRTPCNSCFLLSPQLRGHWLRYSKTALDGSFSRWICEISEIPVIQLHCEASKQTANGLARHHRYKSRGQSSSWRPRYGTTRKICLWHKRSRRFDWKNFIYDMAMVTLRKESLALERKSNTSIRLPNFLAVFPLYYFNPAWQLKFYFCTFGGGSEQQPIS